MATSRGGTMSLLALLIAGCFAEGKVISIEDFGAVADEEAASASNAAAFNRALATAGSGDTVVVPAGKRYWVLGGVLGSGLFNVTVRLDGVLMAAADYEHWPRTHKGKHYADFFSIVNSRHVTVTSAGSGLLDGQGVGWWNKEVLPAVYGKLKSKRPKLMSMDNCTDVLVERLNMLNSPSFHMMLSDMARVEVRYIHINVDRRKQAELKQVKAALRNDTSRAAGDHSQAHLQPEDLNTDGIDPSGRDFWIHDCTIMNDDDSIAVKPCNPEGCVNSDCSRNILVENMVMSGFGASIGSVPPHAAVACVQNVTFRNMTMPGTGKGVYIKSNPSCGLADGKPKRGLIADITYEDIKIEKPLWWAVWIGPQQQHEPGAALGEKCALDYPLGSCPTQGCVDFRNITLRNIAVHEPKLSPGVILGNSTNPIQNLVFDNVRVIKPGYLPFKGKYKCEHVIGTVTGGSGPQPECFNDRPRDRPILNTYV
ncbi:unnamed protein product [Effrenium voratum]|uniref:Polygalacturonase n=1 Tax=Effrenium voratum TaxID=2562239 RepID=A0AA36HU65_9DINO|nr:unnamed protein product [Effrenium voratum]